MLRAVVQTLRQPRYASLMAGMLVLAIGCACAGTFEIHRYREKRHANNALTANAHAAPAALTTSLVPLAGAARAVSTATELRLRRVRVEGLYLAGEQTYLAGQNQGGNQGFYVVTPFSSTAGVLLVERGFVAAGSDQRRPSLVEPPPSGAVTIEARLMPGVTSSDRLGTLGDGEVTTVDPAEQGARLRLPTFAAYGELLAGQPGNAGLDAVPAPDLSNPSGGAGEIQILSYVAQWYLFALLALTAPFLFRRAEIKQARAKFLGIEPGDGQFDLDGRFAQPELAGGPLQSAGGPSGAIAVRRSGAVAERGEPVGERWQRAERIAGRYGLTLGDAPAAGPSAAGGAGPGADAAGPGADAAGPGADRTARERAARRAEREVGVERVMRGQFRPSSEQTPHRAVDEYHGSYNDYLWELALSSGEVPDAGPTSEGVDDGADARERPHFEVDIAPTPIRRGGPPPESD